jgi:hypothetical protein
VLYHYASDLHVHCSREKAHNLIEFLKESEGGEPDKKLRTTGVKGSTPASVEGTTREEGPVFTQLVAFSDWRCQFLFLLRTSLNSTPQGRP